MDEKESKQLLHMTEIEKKAEEIIVDKNDIISLDKNRNWDRESLRALEKLKDKSVWMNYGTDIIKLPKEKAKCILEKDQSDTNVEINKKRSDLKIKVNDLRDLEYAEKYPGFYLNPLSNKELSAMKHVWREKS